MRVSVSKCLCHAAEQAREQVSSLSAFPLFLFKKSNKQDEQSLWEWEAEVLKVYCYVTSKRLCVFGVCLCVTRCLGGYWKS